MNRRPGFSPQGRIVVQGCLFLTFCVALFVALLWTPGLGARQNLDQNRTFVFHGHRVTLASSADSANWHTSKGLNGLPGLVPIPGGINLPPPLPPVIHVFAPGPTNQGLQGIDVEPNVISNFRGFAAQAYPIGFATATDSEGNTYDVNNDMRVFQGEYVSADGTHHRGTFVFI
jgi:hypothetical protein